MDKRYFIIILIILVCLVNLYVIVDFSDVVGSSYTNVGKYTFSLPPGFDLGGSQDKSVAIIHNPKNNLDIAVYSLDKGDYNYSLGLDQLNNNSKINIISNGTLYVDDISVDAVYYDDLSTNSSKSIFYFQKDNHPFRINMVNVDINDKNKTIDDLVFIIRSIRLNYKI